MFILHSGLRIFAAFKIPPLSATDPITTREIPTLRPHLICPFALPTIFAVQFINPWTHIEDCSSSLASSGIKQTSLSFYLTVLDRLTRKPQFLRYDLCIWTHCITGVHVHPPILRQRISLEDRENHDLISPSIVMDELDTFWGTSEGIVYVPDEADPLSLSYVGGVDQEVTIVNSRRISFNGDDGPILKPRISIDAISGRRLVIQGDELIMEELEDTLLLP